MARMIRGALVQAAWTGDKAGMIDRHVDYARQAAQQGAQVLCFQELFNSPYFCQVQDRRLFNLAEPIPDGATVRLMQDLARDTHMVLIAPIYEREAPGVYYNTAAVIDADGTYLGKYRKTHIPLLDGFYEKYYFRPGNLGYPVFDTLVGKVGVYICYDRHFPEGARVLGLNGAEIVFIPAASSRGATEHLWRVEPTSHAIANSYFVAAVNRVGIEPEFGGADFFGQSYFCDPRGHICGEVADAYHDDLLIRDLDLDMIKEVRESWQFYRDRRPDLYGKIVEA